MAVSLVLSQLPKPDLAAETRAFYHSYYQVELTDAQIGALLQP